MIRVLLLVLAVSMVSGCSRETPPAVVEPAASVEPGIVATGERAASDQAPANPARNVFFGDLHLHSRWSFDAFSLGVAVGPRDAYRFARGEAIDHVSGDSIQLAGPPLDFMALTEHAEYLGVSAGLEDKDSELFTIDFVKRLTSEDPAVRNGAIREFARNVRTGIPNPELITDAVIQPTWKRLIGLADEYNEPGVFTAFVGFEWTSAPVGNLHRNLIFRGNNVPERPYSAFDSLHPEDLWTWMDMVRGKHDDILAIPHNANMSDGSMYPLVDSSGSPLTAAWASSKMRNEPITELMQIKGQSETLPALSPEDEWADFEVFNRSVNDLTATHREGKAPGSYVRHALKDGIGLADALGINPYQMGVVGSSDGHNAAGPIEEGRYFGKLGHADGTPAQRLTSGIEPFIPDVVARWSAAGLAGVWAAANTRAALFDALRRRESYSTSGTRIKVRFFAGDFDAATLEAKDLFPRAYELGVPMGGEISQPTRFLIWAARDPLSAPLDRLQIIKGWREGDELKEQVIDVACAAGEPAGAVPRCPALPVPEDAVCDELLDAAGASELRTVWTDPGFDPNERAFYYVRVLERPTCRWSTIQSRELGVDVPEGIATLIQERAVTSAIWYSPAG